MLKSVKEIIYNPGLGVSWALSRPPRAAFYQTWGMVLSSYWTQLPTVLSLSQDTFSPWLLGHRHSVLVSLAKSCSCQPLSECPWIPWTQCPVLDFSIHILPISDLNQPQGETLSVCWWPPNPKISRPFHPIPYMGSSLPAQHLWCCKCANRKPASSMKMSFSISDSISQSASQAKT